MIKLSPNISPSYHFIGPQRIPIIVIDDFCADSTALLNFARQKAEFQPDNYTGYPGIRAPLPKEYIVCALKPLIKGLYKIYNIPASRKAAPKDNYFSLITHKPSSLSPLQTQPHFDNTNPFLIAVIHYLGAGEHGGIGFFQEKITGLTSVSEADKASFYQNLNAYTQSDLAQLGYCDEHNAFFNCYEKFAYKENRVIAFPGYLLHSSLVDLDHDISACPSTGRLTANMFIDFV